MSKRIFDTVFTFGLAAALVGLPACGKDKSGDDKSAEAKDAEPAADEGGEATPSAGEAADHGAADHGEAAAADEVAELGGDGRVDIIVDAGGYHPAEIRAPANSKLTLAFTRTTEQGCGQELVFASMEIEKQLPLNEVVEVEVEVPESGELGFACGMNMYKGKVVPKS